MLHKIRLRKPWTREVRGGLAVWRRRFGRPTGLAGRRVWLAVEGLHGGGTASLNGQPLGNTGADGTGRFEVTGRLLERNEIAIEIRREEPPAGPGTAAAPPSEVCLEIEDLETARGNRPERPQQ